MKKITFEGNTELEILHSIAAELKCSIADGNKYNADILIIRKYTAAALVIYVDIKMRIENNCKICYFKSKITGYEYVGLNYFIYLLINELRMKTKSYTTVPEISKKHYQLGEIEKNAKDLKV
jgi:restriction endonuclease S subunit